MHSRTYTHMRAYIYLNIKKKKKNFLYSYCVSLVNFLAIVTSYLKADAYITG